LFARAADGVVKRSDPRHQLHQRRRGHGAHYLSELLHARGLKVSRIARGLPVGGELEFSGCRDRGPQALRERRDFV
jgi:recombination protein RecR